MSWVVDDGAVALLDREGGPFQRAGFRRAVAASTRWRDVSVGARRADGAHAALAVFARYGIGSAVPYGYGDVVSDALLPAAEREEVLAVLRGATRTRRVHLRRLVDTAEARGTATTLVDLDGSDPLERFHKAARYEVRRAAREGLAVHATDDPAAFLALYGQAAAGWDMQYPSELVRVAAAEGVARSFVATLEGRPVAANIALVASHQWMYWLAAQDDEGRRRGASYSTVLALLRATQEAGATTVNLGASESGGHDLAGVRFFKGRLGGRPATMVEDVVAGPVGRAEAVLERAVVRPLLRAVRR